MTLAADGGAVIVWDETVDDVHRVVLAHVSPSRAIGPSRVLSGAESASHPVIVRTGSDLVVAWASRDESVIRVRRIETAK
jgi:hypothetical protein